MAVLQTEDVALEEPLSVPEDDADSVAVTEPLPLALAEVVVDPLALRVADSVAAADALPDVVPLELPLDVK